MKNEYLIKHLASIDLSFLSGRTSEQPETSAIQKLQPVENPTFSNTIKKEQAESWTEEIKELENYFAGITLPAQPVKLNTYSTITDCSKFIESHFCTVRANNGNKRHLPYLNRLEDLKQVLTINSN